MASRWWWSQPAAPAAAAAARQCQQPDLLRTGPMPTQLKAHPALVHAQTTQGVHLALLQDAAPVGDLAQQRFHAGGHRHAAQGVHVTLQAKKARVHSTTRIAPKLRAGHHVEDIAHGQAVRGAAVQFIGHRACNIVLAPGWRSAPGTLRCRPAAVRRR